VELGANCRACLYAEAFHVKRVTEVGSRGLRHQEPRDGPEGQGSLPSMLPFV
jgi:hypothetical protein